MKDFKELNKKRWFTSDLHFGDSRLNLYSRDIVATTSDEIDELIIKNYNEVVGPDDIVYFLGDIIFDPAKLDIVSRLTGYKILIKGNYDENINDDLLKKYFDEVYDTLVIKINDADVFLNHYPTKCVDDMFNITGHIHALWRVQRNALNVGTDAWHFFPISEDTVKFYINGIKNYYDKNVFAGELESNLKHIK
jgi:calcineurin-like phosphoesterase family protein